MLRIRCESKSGTELICCIKVKGKNGTGPFVFKGSDDGTYGGEIMTYTPAQQLADGRRRAFTRIGLSFGQERHARLYDLITKRDIMRDKVER